MQSFSLAGLLRVRHAQQNLAALELAEANERVRETAARRSRARAALEEGAGAVTDSATMHAIAAARASTRSMLLEIGAIDELNRADLERAQFAYGTARARSIGLEKLEGKHDRAAVAEDMRGEQLVLDEIAQAPWGRAARGHSS